MIYDHFLSAAQKALNLQKYDDAEQLIDALMIEGHNTFEVTYLHIMLYSLTNRLAQCEQLIINSSANFDQLSVLYARLGTNMYAFGKKHLAMLYYNLSLRIDMYNAEALSALIKIDFSSAESYIQKILAKSERGHINTSFHIHYVLGEYFQVKGDYERSYKEYSNGAAFYKQYNKTELPNLVFSRLIINKGRLGCYSSQSSDRTPVFINGLFRTGTTLLESLLIEKYNAHRGGELKYLLSHFNPKLEALSDHAILPSSYAQHIDEVKTGYLHDVSCLFDEKVFTDKSPVNWQFLPVIHLMFPNSILLHTLKHPVETILGIYFSAVGPSWSYNLDLVTKYYLEYYEIMRSWLTLLPKEAVTFVRHEELAAGSFSQLDDHIKSHGLESRLKVSSQQPTFSPSMFDVSKPPSVKYVNKWRHYQPFIPEHIMPAIQQQIHEYEEGGRYFTLSTTGPEK